VIGTNFLTRFVVRKRITALSARSAPSQNTSKLVITELVLFAIARGLAGTFGRATQVKRFTVLVDTTCDAIQTRSVRAVAPMSFATIGSIAAIIVPVARTVLVAFVLGLEGTSATVTSGAMLGVQAKLIGFTVNVFVTYGGSRQRSKEDEQ